MSSDKNKKKRVGSAIFRIILIVIAGLTVGIGVFSWNASGLVGNQLPMPFGFGVSVVMSPSMSPVLNTNDLIFVTEEESYGLDDIVVFQEGNMLVIHRIISIDGDNVITKGDANNIADDPISMGDIKAKLSFHIPFIGIIFKYIKTVPGTLLVLVLAIFLLYRSRQKERDKDREELEDIVEEIKRLRLQQNDSVASEAKDEVPGASESAEKEAISAGTSVAEEVSAEELSDSVKKAEDVEEFLESEKESDSESVDTSHEASEKASDTSASTVLDESTDIAEVKSILEEMSE